MSKLILPKSEIISHLKVVIKMVEKLSEENLDKRKSTLTSIIKRRLEILKESEVIDDDDCTFDYFDQEYTNYPE